MDPNNFAAVQAAIDKRRNLLGETVWAYIGTDARAMVAVEECARHRVNLWLFTKWATNKP